MTNNSFVHDHRSEPLFGRLSENLNQAERAEWITNTHQPFQQKHLFKLLFSESVGSEYEIHIFQ